jgi:hypothetical protein
MPTTLSKESLGYEVHTNRELGLMLRGKKPLAVFVDYEGFFPSCVLRYLRMFDRHVFAGRIVKQVHREHVEVRGAGHELVTILYALPSQKWRIDEMIDLRRHLVDWTSELERREGELLGYTDAENEIWLKRRARKNDSPSDL